MHLQCHFLRLGGERVPASDAAIRVFANSFFICVSSLIGE
jgi:hypothetical protein